MFFFKLLQKIDHSFCTLEYEDVMSMNAKPTKCSNKAINGYIYWMTSEGYLGLLRPTLPVENLQLGHVHFHRNRKDDQISVWMLDTGRTWDNITDRWGMDTTQPIRYPLNSSIILDTLEESGRWEPTYVTGVFLIMSV